MSRHLNNRESVCAVDGGEPEFRVCAGIQPVPRCGVSTATFLDLDIVMPYRSRWKLAGHTVDSRVGER